MSTGYQIDDQSAMYFLTLTVVDWVDIFTRKIYRDIVLESLTYCRTHKGLEIWAYVVMSNHLHLIVSAKHNNLSAVIRDFKRHTATHILKAIRETPESRKDWMLKRFEFAAMKNKRSSEHQFWQYGNHAIVLESPDFTCQKLAYIHLNPVRTGWVEKASDWLYSSQRNYEEREGLMEIDLLEL